ncbi:hypothetical protein [Egibacter rhizosphaerae]|uniref:hypothetical protein n=1 Tax=Egibacter rhizosphaerae TaxID=1670831 RepID=UPI00197AC5CA|nr:hypothetical protein [Egibacter rhizosphaerae]
MGWTEARVEDARFVLREEHHRPALERLLRLARETFHYDLSDLQLRDVDGFLRLLGFATERDGGDIVGLAFEDKLVPEIEDVFDALAPYLEAGSYVRMHGGTNARWRYDFDGNVCHRRDEPPDYWKGR